MKKLEHSHTVKGRDEIIYMISIGGSIPLDSWNYFYNLGDADRYLESHFVPSEEVEYAIREVHTIRKTYIYK